MIKIRYILTTRINGNVCTCTRYMLYLSEQLPVVITGMVRSDGTNACIKMNLL